MSASTSPSINFLLNPACSPPQQPRTSAETLSRAAQPISNSTMSLINMPAVNHPNGLPITPLLSFRDPFVPGSSTTNSPCSRSTTADLYSPHATQTAVPVSRDTNIDDVSTHHQRPTNASLSIHAIESFHQNAKSTTTLQPPRVNPSNGYLPMPFPPSRRSVFINSLLQTCTTSALKFYHSLLPPPTLSISIQQTHLQPEATPDSLQLSIMTEYFPFPSPHTASLCAEALSAIKAANATMPLTYILVLISHATHPAYATNYPQQLTLHSHHATRMAGLWDLTNRLLALLSKTAQGIWLDQAELVSASQRASALCDKMGDEAGARDVERTTPGFLDLH
jgi:hypothetical protein